MLDALTPQDCLITLMLTVSASDGTMRTVELVQITAILDTLPVFADVPEGRLGEIGALVEALIGQEDGLDSLFETIRDRLPDRLWETAYALACDVAAADGRISEGEADILEEIADQLRLDRLHAAAIERGARARWQRL